MITIWIVIPAFVILMACVTSDIIEGVCVPWGLLGRFMDIMVVFITYLLPLSLMTFCYSRIVHSLRTKVYNSTLYPYFHCSFGLCNNCTSPTT